MSFICPKREIESVIFREWIVDCSLDQAQRLELQQSIPENTQIFRVSLEKLLASETKDDSPQTIERDVQKEVKILLEDFERFRRLHSYGTHFAQALNSFLVADRHSLSSTSYGLVHDLLRIPELYTLVERSFSSLKENEMQSESPEEKQRYEKYRLVAKLLVDPNPTLLDEARSMLDRDWPRFIAGVPLDVDVRYPGKNIDHAIANLTLAYKISSSRFHSCLDELLKALDDANPKMRQAFLLRITRFMTQRTCSDRESFRRASEFFDELIHQQDELNTSSFQSIALDLCHHAAQHNEPFSSISSYAKEFLIHLESDPSLFVPLRDLCMHYPELLQLFQENSTQSVLNPLVLRLTNSLDPESSFLPSNPLPDKLRNSWGIPSLIEFLHFQIESGQDPKPTLARIQTVMESLTRLNDKKKKGGKFVTPNRFYLTEMEAELNSYMVQISHLALIDDLPIAELWNRCEHLAKRYKLLTPGTLPDNSSALLIQYLRPFLAVFQNPVFKRAAAENTREALRSACLTRDASLAAPSEVIDTMRKLVCSPFELDPLGESFEEAFSQCFLQPIQNSSTEVKGEDIQEEISRLLQTFRSNRRMFLAVSIAFRADLPCADLLDMRFMSKLLPVISEFKYDEIYRISLAWTYMRKHKLAEDEDLGPEENMEELFIRLASRHPFVFAQLGKLLAHSRLTINKWDKDYDRKPKRDRGIALIKQTLIATEALSEERPELLNSAFSWRLFPDIQLDPHSARYGYDPIHLDVRQPIIPSIRSTFERYFSIPGMRDFWEDPPSDVDLYMLAKGSYALANTASDELWEKEISRKLLWLTQTAPQAVALCESVYNRPQFFAMLVKLVQELHPQDAACFVKLLVKHDSSRLATDSLKKILRYPELSHLLRHAEGSENIVESLASEATPDQIRRITKVCEKYPELIEMFLRCFDVYPKQLSLLCELIERYPIAHLLGSFSSSIANSSKLIEINSWEDAQICVLAEIQDKIKKPRYMEILQSALKKNCFLVRLQFQEGLSFELYQEALNSLSPQERSDAVLDGFRCLYANLAVQEDKNACDEDDERDENDEWDEDDEWEDLDEYEEEEEEEEAERADDLDLPVEQIGELVDDQSEVEEDPSSPDDVRLRSDLEEEAKPPPLELSPEQKGALVALDRVVPHDALWMYVTLAKNHEYLLDPLHLDFIRKIYSECPERSKHILEAYFSELAEETSFRFQNPDDDDDDDKPKSFCFSEATESREEVESIQACLLCYFGMEEEGSIDFEKYDESKFKAFLNIQPSLRTSFKETLSRIFPDASEDHQEFMLRLACEKSVNEHFDIYEIFVLKASEIDLNHDDLIRVWGLVDGDMKRLDVSIETLKNLKPFDLTFHKYYVTLVFEGKREAAEAYLTELRSPTHGLVSPDIPTELRAHPHYLFILKNAYAEGERSSHENNLKCGDRIQHLDAFEFDREGYHVRLTGLLGYSLKAGKKEDLSVLEHYGNRIRTIRDFIHQRGVSNQELVRAFEVKIDLLFEQHAHDEFKEYREKCKEAEGSSKDLNIREKLLILFLSEALRKKLGSRTTTVNTKILDLIVLYHYVFNEYIEEYIHRSADTVRSYKDPTTEHFMLLNEASNIYGESLKHNLRHAFVEASQDKVPCQNDVFTLYSTLLHAASGAPNREKAIQTFRKRSESFITNKKIPPASRFSALLRQVKKLVTPPNYPKEKKAQLYEKAEEIMAVCENKLTVESYRSVIPALLDLRDSLLCTVDPSVITKDLEEVFSVDSNAIFREIAKYEEEIETDVKENGIGNGKEIKKQKKIREIVAYYMKTQESACARLGAYLCFSNVEEMYDNPNYFELILFDKVTAKCVGLTMHLTIMADDGKKYLFFAPNPNQSFLEQVSARKCFDFQYNQVCSFAEQNGYDAVVIVAAEDRIQGECTNRGGMYPDLIKARRLRDEEGKIKIVQFGKDHELGQYEGSPYSYSEGAVIWERGIK